MKSLEKYNLFKKKYRVGILTAPTEKASVPAISNLIEILKPLSNTLTLVTGNASYNFFKNDKNIFIFDISYRIEGNPVKKILNYFFSQLYSSWIILKERKTVDIWFFFMGGERQFFPILLTKLLKKPSLLMITGSYAKIATYSCDPFSLPIKLLYIINCELVGGIILYSPKLIVEAELDRHEDKIFVAQRHFVDQEQFNIKVDFSKREEIIGYFGRLSKEKGVLNFIFAAEKIRSRNPDLKIIIGGEGELGDQIKQFIHKNNLQDMISLLGWVPHEELPDHLNKLKLLVLPSYTEGFPNIILESMACGVPVLATPVGAVCDILDDGVTGFLLEQNSPEKIADTIINIFEQADLERIAKNGKENADLKYSLKKASDDFDKIIDTVSG
ncbi:MAG: glycosyltransferase family 4 protein [Methanoregula sp.]|nr:glycosyltransferase family 4 protein [Methanoregula sp.]